MQTAIIFDLEFTAWSGSMEHRWMRPGEHREVVQIGAIKLDTATLEEIESFNVLVKPRLNPVLSPYFEALTGVTNEAVGRLGVDFAEAYRAFVGFAAGAPLYAFGRDDLVLMENVRLYGLRGVPALPLHINIVSWLIDRGIDPRGLHACDIAQATGASFVGRKHDALADARSIAAGIGFLVGRGAPSPFALARAA